MTELKMVVVVIILIILIGSGISYDLSLGQNHGGLWWAKLFGGILSLATALVLTKSIYKRLATLHERHLHNKEMKKRLARHKRKIQKRRK